MMYDSQNSKNGLFLAAASMAAEALALSRVVCTEGELLSRANTPELYESAAKLLTAVTQSQRELNRRLEAALTACGRFPAEDGEFRLAGRYGGFWWEAPQALPWRRLAAGGRGFVLEPPGKIRLLPGKQYQLCFSLTAVPVGAAAQVFLRVAASRRTREIPMFMLRTKGPLSFRKAVELYTDAPTDISLEVSGPLGACVVQASVDGFFSPSPLCDASVHRP